MEISQALKAISNPIRLQMVELLLQKRMCVRSLARHFEVSEPTISVHLNVLKKAGLIVGEKKSYYMHYHVIRENIAELSQFFTALSATSASEPQSCRKSGSCHCRCHSKRIDFTVKKIFVTIALSVAALACAGEYSMEYSGKRTKLFRNGNAVDFLQCVTEQIKRYPDSEIDDFVKLAYQASWGPAHALADRSAAWKYFSREFSAVKPDNNIPLFEIISPDYCRINLGAWKQAGLPEKWLFNMFYASAEVLPDSHIIFNDYIRQLRTVLGERKNALDDFMKQYRGGAVHHSLRYREKYQPHYRLVNVRFLTALPVLMAAAKIPQKSITVIAVDGRAASGKTTLARQLAAVLETDAIHMDDFFLPLELRTPARLAEPGGNIHYERFKTEVLPFLKQSNSFSYQCFDCSKMSPGKMRNIPAARWRIVEGAYSLHPAFGSYADLKVFLDISKEEQIKRIRKRNGEQKAAIFAKRWIPMEEKYINTFDIKAKADIIVGN